MLLGNDVIDLQFARPLEKSRDSRFVDRVFTPLERDCIRASFDPEWTLWILWSAKEAAFKITRKLNPQAVFAHQAFSANRATLDLILHSPKAHALKGGLEIQPFALQWACTNDHIHCVASTGSAQVQSRVATSVTEEISLSPRELESVHSEQSRLVRVLAKSMVASKYSSAELVRPTGGAPALYHGSMPIPGVDLSLSHDGRFVAVVVSEA